MKRLAVLSTAVALAYAATGIYFVQPDEQALVRRCGRLLDVPREPGAHFGLPWGLDRVDRIRPREVKRVTIGPVNLGGETAGSETTQFLTGDRNLVCVQASVQYTVSQPAEYLLQTEDVDRLIANSAEATLADLLCAQPVDKTLTLGKQELGLAAQEHLQSLADRYGLGVMIRSVDIISVEPPPEVAEAFAKVVSALREREQQIHQAHSYANRVQAEAQANAQRSRNAARSYYEQVVRQAEGQADRFERLATEYRQAPTLTARRMYLQTMSDLLPRIRSKLIIASDDDVDISIVNPDR